MGFIKSVYRKHLEEQQVVWWRAQSRSDHSRAVGDRGEVGIGAEGPPTNRTLSAMPDEIDVYEAVGGMRFFETLVDRFYARVAADPLLVRLYPQPQNLGPARRKLALFLAQYWGGPDVYSRERGHPALRMRHAPFAIGPAERDAWLGHMRAAVASTESPAGVERAMLEYFGVAGEALRNRDGPASEHRV